MVGVTARSERLVDTLDFQLPATLEAGEPPEARGLARDDVRLLVSYRHDERMVHARFRDIGCFLEAGDVLVINTSGTRPAAVSAERTDGQPLLVHLSTQLPSGQWLVELRRPTADSHLPFREGRPGETLRLGGGGTLRLEALHAGSERLWVSQLELPAPVDCYLAAHGAPIRYSYVDRQWPLSYYQTVYATEAGSAEMPSAGRAFTPELITGLVARGVQVAPLILHTGVASLEEHEPPYEEYYRVPAATARVVNSALRAGRRVVAVGTTVVRALETVAAENGEVVAGEGWTELVITPERGLYVVDGLLTGLHEPKATHLAMLAALAGEEHLRVAYEEALRERYLWHEFGDLHLLLP